MGYEDFVVAASCRELMCFDGEVEVVRYECGIMAEEDMHCMALLVESNLARVMIN